MDIAHLIDAPCDRVWDLLTDTQQWPKWGPSVTGVRCADRFIRQGSRGEVRTALGLWLPFAITEFTPTKRWSWRVSGIAATGHRVETVEGGGCRLVFEVPLLAAPYGLVCRLAARRISRMARGRAS